MNQGSEILDCQPPCSLEAERWVLGSCILDPNRLQEVATALQPEDFYADAHRKVYTELLRMDSERKAIDVGLLVARLRQTKELEAIGGMAFVAELYQGVPTAYHAAHYAAIVVRLAKYRRLIHASLATLQAAYGQTAEPDDLVEEAEVALLAIAQRNQSNEPMPIQEAAIKALDRIEAIVRRGRTCGVLTGFPSIDDTFGGLFNGELTTLVARPGIGKTALAAQIAHYVASAGKLVYYATVEMSAVELTLRSICSEAAVSLLAVRRGKVNEGDMVCLVETANAIGMRKLHVHNAAKMSTATIRRACIRLKREGLALIVADYLQNLEPRERTRNRYEDVGSISRELKWLAVELDVPVLVPTQEGREADKDRGKVRLSLVRESGNVEADADNVLFLRCPIAWGVKNHDGEQDPANPASPHPRQAALIAEKCRNGPRGTVRLVWDKERVRFLDPSAHSPYSEFDAFKG